MLGIFLDRPGRALSGGMRPESEAPPVSMSKNPMRRDVVVVVTFGVSAVRIEWMLRDRALLDGEKAVQDGEVASRLARM